MEEKRNLVRNRIASSSNYLDCGCGDGVLPNGSRGKIKKFPKLYIEVILGIFKKCHFFFDMWSFYRDFRNLENCHFGYT